MAYDAYVDGLRFFYERAGCEPSSRTGNLASMLRSVARHWVKVDEATLARMGQVVRKLSVSQEGLTAKNRERLRAFDDEAKVDALLRLPQDLRHEVERGKLPARRAAVQAGLAVAIELLIVAPVRRQNLAAIDLERHLVRTGRKLHLVVPGREVKNAQDLEFELPERTAELIDWYLREHRPVLAMPGCTALFPVPERQGQARRDVGPADPRARLRPHRAEGEPAPVPAHRGQAVPRRDARRLRGDPPRARPQVDCDDNLLLCRGGDGGGGPALRRGGAGASEPRPS